MRVGAAAALICTLLMAGCGSVNAPPMTPVAEQSSSTRDPELADQSDAPDDRQPSSETQRRKRARSAAASDASAKDAHSDPSTEGLLSPGWAKEEQNDKEDWEKSLDKTINNICRGC